MSFPHRHRSNIYHLDISFTPQTRYTILDSVLDTFQAGEDTYDRDGHILMMSAAYTNLTQVPQEALNVISSTLEFLSLKGNNFSESHIDQATITDDDHWAVFPFLPNLRELDVRNCQISVLKHSTFANLPGLQRLYMAHNQFSYITPNVFKVVPQLFHLDLSYNTIPIDPNDELDSNGNSKVADPFDAMSDGLYVPDNIFAEMSQLLFLDMSYTRIISTSARAFSQLPRNIQLVSLCYTSIPLIPAGMFNGTQLRVLDLSGNPQLAFNLERGSLNGLAATLNILSVENSNIKSLHWFCRLERLKILQLSGNNINQLTSSTFRGLDDIEMLDLSRNHLGNWYTRVFANNPALKLLKLQNNNINLISTEMFQDFQQLDYLAIGSNSFICTCNLREFMDVAMQNSRAGDKDGGDDDDDNGSRFNDHIQPNIEEIIKSHLLNGGHRRPPSVLAITGGGDGGEAYATFGEIMKRSYDVDNRISHETQLSMQTSHENIEKLMEKYSMYEVVVYRPLQVHLRLWPTSRIMIDNEMLNFTFRLIDFTETSYQCINSTTSQPHCLLDIEKCGRSLGETTPPPNEYGDFPEYTSYAWIWVLAVVGVLVITYLLVYYQWRTIRFFCLSLRNVTILSRMKEDRGQLMRRARRRRLGPDAVEVAPDDEVDGAATAYNYDVFVSYCDENRNWILDEFLPNIDQCRDIKVCLHERDFQVCHEEEQTLRVFMKYNFKRLD